MKSKIFYLRENYNREIIGDIVILKNEVDRDEFAKSIEEIWDTLISQEDYEFDTFYDMIEEKYEVEEFIFIDNFPTISYN